MKGQRVHKVLLSLNVELNTWHVAEGRITCAEVVGRRRPLAVVRPWPSGSLRKKVPGSWDLTAIPS
jgi:hypothetical protein